MMLLPVLAGNEIAPIRRAGAAGHGAAHIAEPSCTGSGSGPGWRAVAEQEPSDYMLPTVDGTRADSSAYATVSGGARYSPAFAQAGVALAGCATTISPTVSIYITATPLPLPVPIAPITTPPSRPVGRAGRTNRRPPQPWAPGPRQSKEAAERATDRRQLALCQPRSAALGRQRWWPVGPPRVRLRAARSGPARRPGTPTPARRPADAAQHGLSLRHQAAGRPLPPRRGRWAASGVGKWTACVVPDLETL